MIEVKKTPIFCASHGIQTWAQVQIQGHAQFLVRGYNAIFLDTTEYIDISLAII